MVYDISHSTIDAATKTELYRELQEKFEAVVTGERNAITNMANLSALVYHELNNSKFIYGGKLNWTGVYYVPKSSSVSGSQAESEPNILQLGPFQGNVACTKIKFGLGVCGTVAKTHSPLIVPNVHNFPGHIACDSASVSEVVVPIVLISSGPVSETSQLIGVFDLDCAVADAFDHDDVIGLSALANTLATASDWTL